MADSTIGISADRRGPKRRLIWSDSTTAYLFYTKEALPNNLVYKKTTDGGLSWSTENTLGSTNGAVVHWNAWADWWTPGYECNPYIHFVIANSGGPVFQYNRLDVTDDSTLWAGSRTVFQVTGGISAGSTPNNCDIIRARGGYIYLGAWNSWVTANSGRIALMASTGIEETTQEWKRLDTTNITTRSSTTVMTFNRTIFQPGDQTDCNDFMIIVRGSTEVGGVIKRAIYDHDATAGSGTDSTFEGLLGSWFHITCNDYTALYGSGGQNFWEFDVAYRHHDNKSIAVWRFGFDASTAEYRIWEIGSTSATELTKPPGSPGDDQIDCALTIVNNSYHNDTVTWAGTTNPWIYLHVLGSTDEDQGVHVNAGQFLSTDGGQTWNSRQVLSDSTTGTPGYGRKFNINGSFSIGGRSGRGGQVAAVWLNNQSSSFSYISNSTQYTVIANTTGDCSLFAPPATTDAGVGTGSVVPSIIIDFNANGNLETSEDISSYVTALSWRRGGEPEETITPSGTMQLQLTDSSGSFLPNSTFWGDGNIQPGRMIRATMSFDGNEYTIFRGRVSSFQPRMGADGVLYQNIFAVDEMDELRSSVVSWPNSTTSTGEADITIGDRPAQSYAIGGTTGIIDRILTETTWDSRRQLSETGSTLDWFFAYQENVGSILDNLARHDKRGRVFMNSSGSVTFHSFTHREGAAVTSSFPGNFSWMEFTMTARDVNTRAVVTTHSRDASTHTAYEVVGYVGVNDLPTIATGSTYALVVDFINGPVYDALVPMVEKDSTKGISAVGGGTSYAPANVRSEGRALGGGMGMEIKIINASGVTISISRPEGAADTNQTIPVVGRVMTDYKNTSTAQQGVVLPTYGSRTIQEDYEFLSGLGKGSARATDLLENTSTSHFKGVRMGLEASDSNIATALLAREIDDRVSVSSTKMALSKEFYITAVEGHFRDGFLSGVYTLEEAT